MSSSLVSKQLKKESNEGQNNVFSTLTSPFCSQFLPIINKVSKIGPNLVSYQVEATAKELKNLGYIVVENAAISVVVVLAIYAVNGITSAYRERFVYKNFIVNDVNGLRLYLNTKREICPISTLYNLFFLVNVITYTAWQVPENFEFLNRYFTVSVENNSISFMSLLLSSFSHNNPGHLLISMSSIYVMLEVWKHHNHTHCTILDSCHGGEFFSFFISSAIFTNLCSLTTKYALEINYPTFGSSGVICSLMAYQLSAMPKTTFLFDFPILGKLDNIDLLNAFTICSILGCAGMISNKLFDLNWNFSTDYSTHVAGYIFGVWYSNGGDTILKRWSKFAAKKAMKFFDSLGF